MSGADMADLLVGATFGAVQQATQVGERGRGRFDVLDSIDPLSRGQRPRRGQHCAQLNDARLEVIKNDGQIRTDQENRTARR